jgi:hypothetical protein
MDAGKQLMWRSMRDAGVSADVIRQRFRADDAPIAVGRIATGLGIELAEGSGGSFAGRLLLQPDRAWLWTPADDSKELRRFTLAYLIGHVLRMPFGEYQLSLGYERGNERPEIAGFARELLMPRELLSRLINEDQDDEASLSRRLGVLPAHLKLRLKELRLSSPAPSERTQQDLKLGTPFDDLPEDNDRTEVGGELPFQEREEREDKTEPAGRIDRRVYERVNARFEVRFSLPGQAANALLAYSKDVSVGGLCIKTSRAHEVGDQLDITMVVADETFELHAVVSWTRSGFVGVRFVDVPSEDQTRLQRLIRSLKR